MHPALALMSIDGLLPHLRLNQLLREPPHVYEVVDPVFHAFPPSFRRVGTLFGGLSPYFFSAAGELPPLWSLPFRNSIRVKLHNYRLFFLGSPSRCSAKSLYANALTTVLGSSSFLRHRFKRDLITAPPLFPFSPFFFFFANPTRSNPMASPSDWHRPFLSSLLFVALRVTFLIVIAGTWFVYLPP